MDAYVFGNHNGAMPTQLLGGDSGNRVRALARLDGAQHDAFYALLVDDPDGVDVVTETLTGHGLVINSVHIAATNQDKVSIRVVPHVMPSHIPPWEFYLLIEVEGVDDVPEELGTVQQELGTDAVAAVIDSEGNLLIELGGKDQAALAEAGAKLADAFGGNVTTHSVAGGGIVTG